MKQRPNYAALKDAKILCRREEYRVCKRHGAKPVVYLCKNVGCTNFAPNGGVCRRHGAKINYAAVKDVQI